MRDFIDLKQVNGDRVSTLQTGSRALMVLGNLPHGYGFAPKAAKDRDALVEWLQQLEYPNQADHIQPVLGGMYRTRCGDTVTIIEKYPGNAIDEPFPFAGTNGHEYDYCGRADVTIDEHPSDLVETIGVPTPC